MNSFGMNSLEGSPSNPTFRDFLNLNTEERDDVFLRKSEVLLTNILTSVMNHQIIVCYCTLKKCFVGAFPNGIH